MGFKMGDVELSIGKTGHIPLIGDRVYINRLEDASYYDNFSDGDECIITGIEYVLDTWNDVKIRRVGVIEFLHVKTGVIDRYNDFHLRTKKEVCYG